MDLRGYKKIKALELSTDSDYVTKWISDDPEYVLDNIESETLERDLFFHQFMKKMEDKSFVRNIERMDNNSIDYEEIKKVISSCLTHMFIEDSKEEIPQTAFDFMRELLKECFEGEDYETIYNQLKEFI